MFPVYRVSHLKWSVMWDEKEKERWEMIYTTRDLNASSAKIVMLYACLLLLQIISQVTDLWKHVTVKNSIHTTCDIMKN